MATYYFLGTIDSDWNEMDNWYDAPSGGNQGFNPSSSDDVIILNAVNTNSGGSITVNSMTIEGSGSITNITVTATSTLIQSGGSLGTGGTISGPVTVGSGGVIGGSTMSVATVTGALTFSGSGSTTSGNSGTVVSVSTDVIFSSNWTGTAEYISAGVNVIFNYGYSGSASNLTVTGSTLYADYPTLYFYNAMSADWGNATNWWVDSGHSQQASSIPDSTQDVILNSDVTSDSSPGAVANNLTVNYNGMNSGKLWISITVTTLTTFSTDTYYGDSMNSRTLTSPTVTFNGNSYLNSNASIVGDVNFYDTSSNSGSITGDVTVYSTHAVPFDSSHGNTGTISGTISYSGYSPRTVYFYHASSSEDWGNISYWWDDSAHSDQADYIPNSNIALDNVIIEASVGSNTGVIDSTVGSLTASGTIWIGIDINCQEANFYDSSIFGYGSGTLTHNASNNITFHDLSENEGTIIPDASYPVEFRDSSTNTGTIDGDADVYYPSDKPIGGTVNGTVTYYGWTLYFGGGMNDGDWNNPNNWYLDSSNAVAYNDIPSDTIPYQNVILQYNVSASNQPPYPGVIGGIPSAYDLLCSNGIGIENITIVVSNLATFSGANSYLIFPATIDGNALIKDTSFISAGTITGTATFTFSAAEVMIVDAYGGTYGNIEFQYGKGVNGSNILGIV